MQFLDAIIILYDIFEEKNKLWISLWELLGGIVKTGILWIRP